MLTVTVVRLAIPHSLRHLSSYLVLSVGVCVMREGVLQWAMVEGVLQCVMREGVLQWAMVEGVLQCVMREGVLQWVVVFGR